MATVLELYEKLKPKLGDEEARALLEYVDTNVEQKAATKEDLQRGLATLETTLRKEIHEVKVDLLKWSFAFWVGAIAVLSGIMFTLLRSFGPR